MTPGTPGTPGTVRPFGDRAVFVAVADNAAAHRLAAAVAADRHPPYDVGDVIIGFRSVVVELPTGGHDSEGVERWVHRLDPTVGTPTDPVTGPVAVVGAQARRIELPVVFDGPDLSFVAAITGMTTRQVVSSLTGARLQVAFLGFSPGFAYLRGLPPELAAVARRPQPRTSVPAGSVAVAGGFASVYPQSTPGGWMLLGRTAVELFDPELPPYALLRSGDEVRFTESTGPAPGPGPADDGSDRPLLAASGPRPVEVVEAGLLTTVQDLGRTGVAAVGVPRAGAADPDALVLANRLMGNPDGAACLEVTAVGPTLRFTADAHACVVGHADVTLDGRDVAAGTVLPVAAGQALRIGTVRSGLRATVAFAGGLATPQLFGSRSVDVLSGLGTGPLRAGDELDLGTPSRPHGHLDPSLLDDGDTTIPRVLRALPGPHDGGGAALDALATTTFVVRPDSNRIGVRLEPEGDGTIVVPDPPVVDSCPVVTGAVQVPPSGRPIVLLPDHATVGGYPVLATVITADHPVLGRLRPGDRVRLRLVGPEDARAASVEHARRRDAAVAGWYPTGSGT